MSILKEHDWILKINASRVEEAVGTLRTLGFKYRHRATAFGVVQFEVACTSLQALDLSLLYGLYMMPL